ncbi:hypothetical protein BG004_000483 [Podila humilis]|nr:hypothetical protein BG004_000483 [Podila humilis]
MIFSTLSKASLALIATTVVLLLTQTVESHSYADCIDWRFKNPKNPSWADKNGACFGYARRFPMKSKAFAKLDSDDPNRHYQQDQDDPMGSPACSNGEDGEEPGADERMGKPYSKAYNGKDERGRKTGPMTVSKAGGRLCIRWPAKNHAVPSEKNRPVTISLSGVNPKKDPSQREFLKKKIVELNYKNCTDKGSNTDVWPCGGCFNLPKNLKKGVYAMQWRWQLNSNEHYTSCADIQIK